MNSETGRRLLESGARSARTFWLLLLAALLTAGSAQAAERAIQVRYVTASTIYLDAGRAEGLAVGERVEVVRGGEVLAVLEIDYVAEHSASCRVVSGRATPAVGDLARRAAGAPGPAEESAPPVAAPPTPLPVEPPATPARRTVAAPHTRVSGSLAIAFRSYSDDLGPTGEESTGRLSLRLRDIAGHPWEMRVRARRRELTREGFGPSVPVEQDADRLYELSLAWVPPAGRVHLHFGRLGAGPFPSLGDLDGALGEVRLGAGFWAGAFGGARPLVDELGFENAGEKYGAFFRWAYSPADSPAYAELLVGGVSETDDEGEASRDFVAVESRFGSGSRWWLSQRAEIDLNRDWREEVSGRSTEISNAALAASFQLAPSWRLALSYDQRRNLLTADTRPRPEEVFTRYLREGGRAALEWRGAGGWSGSLGLGSERADTVDAATDSAYLSLLHARAFSLPLLLGGDASFYSGDAAEGWVATVRGRWAFRGGHDLGLTVGASESDVGPDYTVSPRSNEWVRLSGTLELPARLWLYGEYEVESGDDFEGDRLFAELGYRF